MRCRHHDPGNWGGQLERIDVFGVEDQRAEVCTSHEDINRPVGDRCDPFWFKYSGLRRLKSNKVRLLFQPLSEH